MNSNPAMKRSLAAIRAATVGVTLVAAAGVTPNWLSGDSFWYRVLTERGTEFVLVDSASGARRRAFDHQRLAESLANATGEPFTAFDLPSSTARERGRPSGSRHLRS